MAEVQAPKSIRIQSGGHPYETVITDQDGKPVEHVVSVVWRADANTGRATAALEFFGVELDVVADVATLSRLLAAEEVCRVAYALNQTLEAMREAEESDPSLERLRTMRERQVREALKGWLPQAQTLAPFPPSSDDEEEE